MKSKSKYIKRSIKDPKTGKRVYFYGKSEREVQRKIFDFEERAEKGRTFREVADEWWSEISERLAVQSIKSYSAALDRALEAFDTRYISDITPKDIHIFLLRLARLGYKRKTLANQRTVLKQIFANAVLFDDLPFNPVLSVQLPPCNAGERRKAAELTDEEKVLESADVWLLPFIALLTGMRKGEILALQWKDIDFNSSMISVSKSVYHEGDRPFIKAPKTRQSVRTVPMVELLKNTLDKHKGKAEDFVISDDGKKPLSNRRYITLMTDYQKKTGVTCTAHQLRHSFATIAIAHGLDAKTVQEVLGHRQISTTLDIYTDFREQNVIKAREKMNMMFKSE